MADNQEQYNSGQASHLDGALVNVPLGHAVVRIGWPGGTSTPDIPAGNARHRIVRPRWGQGLVCVMAAPGSTTFSRGSPVWRCLRHDVQQGSPVGLAAVQRIDLGEVKGRARCLIRRQGLPAHFRACTQAATLAHTPGATRTACTRQVPGPGSVACRAAHHRAPAGRA
jgi:hypothetical protein